ncbi:hypothetical protein [Metabacillus niabensis]|uniref:hypothetical protein n=1 Tax=Metabacillus niabensis TaxID=324854 RepID=UPI0039A3D4CB
MRDFPYVICMLFIGMWLILFVSNYKTEEIRHNAILATMNESVRIASVNSLDNSLRVETGRVEVAEKQFENSFECFFEKNSNFKIENPKFSYSYLKSEDGEIKAVRVKVKDERNTNYQTTYIADVK